MWLLKRILLGKQLGTIPMAKIPTVMEHSRWNNWSTCRWRRGGWCCSRVLLHAVRVLNGYGSGYYSDIVAGLEYVLENPEIKVVNMSLGGPKSSETEPLKEVIKRLEDAGVAVCIAAGNEAQNTKNVAPAAYNYGVIVESAYDVASSGSSISDRGGFAWFSNMEMQSTSLLLEFQSSNVARWLLYSFGWNIYGNPSCCWCSRSISGNSNED